MSNDKSHAMPVIITSKCNEQKPKQKQIIFSVTWKQLTIKILIDDFR